VSVRRTGIISVEQRVKSKGRGGKRPKFVDLQLDDALIPAAEHHLNEIEHAGTQVLDRLQRKWVTG
jgi:hypothetical protein